jgi:hypothetical protein
VDLNATANNSQDPTKESIILNDRIHELEMKLALEQSERLELEKCVSRLERRLTLLESSRGVDVVGD